MIDRPTTIGVLSGLHEACKVSDALKMVKAAEPEHKVKVKAAERLLW